MTSPSFLLTLSTAEAADNQTKELSFKKGRGITMNDYTIHINQLEQFLFYTQEPVNKLQ